MTSEDLAARRTRLIDLAALLILSGAISLSVCGHFLKPHGDALDFFDAAHRLAQGRLPDSMKRGPVFPVVLAAGAAAVAPLGLTDRPPLERAGEWINALLLPVNVILVYLLGSHWFGGAARWAAAVFALSPIGMYCTAHVLVEPLLIALLLTCLLAVQRGWWTAAWLLASIACLTRYDAAGIVAGLALAACRAGQSSRRVALRSILALAPMAFWIAMTPFVGNPREGDHYIAQMMERPMFEPGWAVMSGPRGLIDPARLILPGAISVDGVGAARLLPGLLLLIAAGGAWGLARRCNPSASAALVAWVLYTLVHAVFPFHFERFGYVMSPLIVLAAGAGAVQVAHWLSLRPGWAAAGRGMFLVVTGLLIVLGLGEAGSLALRPADPRSWSPTMAMIAAVAAGMMALAPLIARPGIAAALLGILAMAVLGRVQSREASALLGPGDDTRAVVSAARWAAGSGNGGVLTDVPGLLGLHAPHRRERFVGLWDIRANDWQGLLHECRGLGITRILWHAGLEHEGRGPLYAPRYRSHRLSGLGTAEIPSGVREVWRAEGPVPAIVYQIDPVSDSGQASGTEP